MKKVLMTSLAVVGFAVATPAFAGAYTMNTTAQNVAVEWVGPQTETFTFAVSNNGIIVDDATQVYVPGTMANTRVRTVAPYTLGSPSSYESYDAYEAADQAQLRNRARLINRAVLGY